MRIKRALFKALWGFAALFWLIFLFQIICAQKDTVIIDPAPPLMAQDSTTQNKESLQNKCLPIEKKTQELKAVDALPYKDSLSTKPLPCVKINTADRETLITLHGIGPVLAERIIAYRKEQGSFNKPKDLMLVKGIGPKKLKKIEKRLCF